ncbi:hypothetical protein EDB89DRAFT_1629378 [Lactarius sanguifluus]|nr:hypothetical protein EDB89DRAFT_1629378 [Lactarius sanguifluus]
MTDYLPSNYTKTITDVADYIDRGRRSGGLWRSFTSQQIIRRGEAYMGGSRTLLDQYHPVMDPGDERISRVAYNQARDARDKLETSNVSGFQKRRKAKKFKGLSKAGYQTVKRASDRGLDNSVVGPRGAGGTDPPVPPGASPTTPEDSDGTDTPESSPEEPNGTGPPGRTGSVALSVSTHGIFPAGVPPATPEELDTRPPPHDPSTDSHATLSLGAAGIGGPTDEVRDTYSSISDPDLASSEASIASYKTERTVNSRKSRHNALPRRKYVDSDHLGVTEGIASLNVDDASVQGGEIPTAGPPPGPSLDQRMTDRAQEADCVSHISSQGLGSEAGADD